MPTLALLLAPLLALSGAAAASPRHSAALRGPIRSLCIPPDDSAGTPRRQFDAVSFQPPAEFLQVTHSTDLQLFQNGPRYFGITNQGSRSFFARSDFLGRTSCRTTINGRSVTVTTGTMELETSQPLVAPGAIGVQNLVMAEWDQLVAGHPLMAFAIVRVPAELDLFRATLYSIRVAGDSIRPTLTLAQLLPHWEVVRTDTIAGLELATQTMGGRARFVARSVGGDLAVTTPELEPDSVRAWSAAIEALSAAPGAGIRALGSSVSATSATVGGKPAVAVSFAEETSDAQVALALTAADATRLAGALRAAMDVLTPRAH